jgi:hypothetical protein
MTLTLAQLAKVETDPLKKYVIMNIIRSAPIMELVPWNNVDSLKSVAVRWQTLPSVAFRQINGSYTANEGDVEQVWESVYGFGGEIAWDRVFELVKNTITDLKKLHTDMKLKALALTFNDYFINGDHATDADGFEGLKKRIAGMPSRQTVYFAGASAAPLDPTNSTIKARAFVDFLEQVCYKTLGGAEALLMNEDTKYGVGRAMRYAQVAGGSFLDVTQDSFERDIPTFHGAMLTDMGLKKDQSTEVITNTEVAGDSGADSTSVYGVRFDEMDGLVGIQLEPMAVYDPLNGGEDPDTPAKKLRIDWWLGLASFGSHGIVRGRNLAAPSSWT